jgi:hypothetical protein
VKASNVDSLFAAERNGHAYADPQLNFIKYLQKRKQTVMMIMVTYKDFEKIVTL